MYKGPTDFAPQQVSLHSLPLLVNHNAETLVSLTTITKRHDSVYVNELEGSRRYPSQPLLYLFNADLDFSFIDSGSGNRISLPHPGARSMERGPAYMAYVELENVIPERVYGDEHVYRAFLTSMNVYSVTDDNPFKDLPFTFSEEIPVEEGYPYLPPATHIKERQYPLHVTIETLYRPHAELIKVAEKLDEEVNKMERYLREKAKK